MTGRTGRHAAAAVVAIAALAGASCTPASEPPKIEGQVVWIHDGDTISVRLGDRKEKIRLIGIDTPELHDERPEQRRRAYAARDYAIGRLKGKTVALESDPLVDDRDAYGRLLRYVVLPDGTNFNEEMVREGHARVYRRFPFSLSQRFLEAEARAGRP